MNIVQLQYKLRDEPLSIVQAAANGQNPQIPEMLATMELNRRQRLQNAGAKPPTKSIKEQLEEKLSSQPEEQMGLPGVLQQAQQSNGEPQQDQVQQPGQSEPRMGGVAGLPTGAAFKQFNSGGIVAFAEGDLVEDESAAETARLKRAELAAADREFQNALELSRRGPAPAPQVTPEVQRANATIMQAPFVNEASNAIREMTSVDTTTPEQEMEKRQALLEKYGIRPPKEEEMARIQASNQAYEKDRAARAELQAQQGLAEAARPNVYGRYMPGTLGKVGSTFGLANLDADRTFREANEKSAVAAKEAQREFKMGNLSDAITASRKSEEYKRDANKAAATAYGQMAAHGLTALTQQLSTEENKRYHDMWANLEDKKLKAQIARDGQDKIPEVMKNIDYIKKNFPSIAKSMTPEQLIEYSIQISAEARGAGSREDIAAAGLMEKRAEKIQQAAGTDPGVLAAKKALADARKKKSPIEEEEALAQLKRAMASIEAQFPIPNIGRRGGLPTLPQGSPQPGANPSPAGKTIKYDAKGNIIP
jgi:hypothetical protein